MKRIKDYDVFELSVEDIIYDEEFNCRSSFTRESIESLAKSIKDHGLLNPLIVQPWDGKYRIVTGHRRFKAMLLLKYETVKASIRTLTTHQAALLNFTENLDRSDLNMLEEAMALSHLYPEGVSLKTASKELGKPTRWVHIRLRLLNMPVEVQQQAAAGMLSAVNIEALVGKEPDEQIIICRKIVETKQGGYILDKDCQRSFRPRRTKEEINKMISKLLMLNISGLGPRGLAWCASQISTDEFLNDIEKYKSHAFKSRSKRHK